MTGGVHICAVVPPPLTGMTHVTEHMCHHLQTTCGAVQHVVRKPDGTGRLRWALGKHFGIYAALREALRQKAETIYFVPDAGRGLYSNLMLHAPLLAKAQRVVLHHHVSSYLTEYTPCFARFLARIARNGAHVTHIALAPCMETKLRALYGVEDVQILGNTPFVHAPNTGQPAQPRQLKCLGFLSNVTRDKGIETFMDLVRSTGLAARIAGPVSDPGLMSELDAFVAEDPENRHLLGPVYGADKHIFFDQIDALVFPTRYPNEAQPLVIYEALAAGLPVLATPQGAIPEQLDGTDWVFAHDAFIQSATPLLTQWRTDASAYQAARVAAQSQWDRAHRADTAALASVLAALSGPATPHVSGHSDHV